MTDTQIINNLACMGVPSGLVRLVADKLSKQGELLKEAYDIIELADFQTMAVHREAEEWTSKVDVARALNQITNDAI
jgi:hypothetical protein